MEFEAVSRVSMSNLGLQIRRQVDDVDRTEWAFLHANTTPDTEPLRNECDSRVRCDFNTKFAGSHNWAGFLAFLATFLNNHHINGE